MKIDVDFDRPAGTIARQIFKLNGRMVQQQALQECPDDKRELVRNHLNTFRLRQKYCKNFNVPFWL